MRPSTVPLRAARRPTAGWRPPTRARVARIGDRLRAVYGIPLMRPHGHPIAELVLTVLSQST
ncbi:MAG: DNA lyase, partial [Solirubrobacteraceae bacterium]